MSDTSQAKTDPEPQFWEQLDGHTAGMLSVHRSSQHMQPMTHQSARDEKALYFFSSRSTDLVTTLTPDAQASYAFISKDHDYHASIKGALSISNDAVRIDQFWSPVIGAWFEGGKTDPDLVLLRLDLHDAAIWASTDSALRFGWEIAKANLSTSQPELGVSNHIWFNRAA